MQEAEEKTLVILELQDEDQTDENDRSVIEFPEKTKGEIKETTESPNILKRLIRRAKGKLLAWWDILGEERERTIKQFFKRALLLPAQVISVLVFCFWLCLVLLCFGDPEE